MNVYQEFIAKSRYARYLEDKKRREHWPETVARYFDFMTEHLRENVGYELSAELRAELESAVLNLEVMPSMRALMTAGPALKRQNLCGYNCSLLLIDDVKSFDELMYLSLCGVGVGFSVERQNVNKLPEIPDQLFPSSTTITVADSKEGWAKALRLLISCLYAGEIPNWDTSKCRPAGAPLKTFGGRSSGPGVLETLFSQVVRMFKEAVGRRLTSLECHDLCCYIAETSESGGSRRSALISLSNLSDDRMRRAKTGNWFDTNIQRTWANNSAVYTEKPDVLKFMEEWKSLIESRSGERGIFNRQAAEQTAVKSGRRKRHEAFGTNPCGEIVLRPYELCNLTEVVVRPTDGAIALANKVRIASILGTFQSTLVHFPYVRSLWRKNCEEERLLGVSLTGIMDNPMTSNWQNPAALADLLQTLRDTAVQVNRELAEELGINVSTAVTTVKPSGNISQRCGCSSGIHPAHSRYWWRTVRQDNKDPLTQFMKDKGVYWEPCQSRPESTTIFYFPQKASDKSKLRDEVTALEQLTLTKLYKDHWAEHNVSTTISVREHEWLEVGAWVYKNFDSVVGLAFLPYDGGSYAQAPYQEVTEEKYLELLAKTPTDLDWDGLIEYSDQVEGAREKACASGYCEI